MNEKNQFENTKSAQLDTYKAEKNAIEALAKQGITDPNLRTYEDHIAKYDDIQHYRALVAQKTQELLKMPSGPRPIEPLKEPGWERKPYRD